MCSTVMKELSLFFLPPPNCNIREMKAMHSSITFQQLTSHRCIHLTLSWNDRMLNGMPKCHLGRKLHSIVKARPALPHKQLELLVHGVILLHDNATRQRHRYVQCWGWEVLAHPTFQVSPHVITGYLYMWKNVFKENIWIRRWYQHCCLCRFTLSKDEYRAATGRLPHMWEKCVDSAGDYVEKRTCVHIQEC
jgi:hypothetical protein